MFIKYDATKEDIKKIVEMYISKVKGSEKNLTGKVISLMPKRETKDYKFYTLVGYELMTQEESTLWTGNNTVICKIATEHYLQHFLDPEDGCPMTTEEIIEKVASIVL